MEVRMNCQIIPKEDYCQMAQLLLQATLTNVLKTNWNDVLRIAGGVDYRWSNRLTLRAGLAFDESPIDTENRGPGAA